MKLLFDDDESNSNENINKKHNILFVKINGERGMNTYRIKQYIQGIQKLKKLDAVFFDWDLTLSKRDNINIDEYIVNTNKGKYKKNLENYFGSDIRINALKKLFKNIRYKKGKIFILTRNPTAIYKHEKKFFVNIINMLEENRKFILTHLYYCHPQISKSVFIKRLYQK